MVTNIHALISTGRSRTSSATPHGGLPDAGSPGAPHSVWIAPPRALKAPIVADSELPVWAFEAACTEYTPRGGTIAVVPGPAAAFGAELIPTAFAPAWLHAAEQVDLPAPGIGPLALAIVLDDPPVHATREQRNADSSRAERFYRGLHQLLAPSGLVLVHTHTQPTKHGLLDPAAALSRAAQAAGLAYLQHVVIVHTRLDVPTTRRYSPPAQQPVPPVCRRVHSDLYVLTNTEGQR